MAQVKGLILYTDNWYFDFYNSLFYGFMFSNFVFFSAVELFSIRQTEWIFAFASTHPRLHSKPGRRRRGRLCALWRIDVRVNTQSKLLKSLYLITFAFFLPFFLFYFILEIRLYEFPPVEEGWKTIKRIPIKWNQTREWKKNANNWWKTSCCRMASSNRWWQPPKRSGRRQKFPDVISSERADNWCKPPSVNIFI